MDNIILVGMPACGKSIIGVVLAKTMGKPFVDTDLLLQAQEGKRLQEIIDESGNAYFRIKEEKLLKELEIRNTVIATGGSAIYYLDAMEKLKENGRIVYIKVSLLTIESRLKNIKTRGVTMSPGETIADLFVERTPLYEQRSDVTVEAEGLTVEETVEKIIQVTI